MKKTQVVVVFQLNNFGQNGQEPAYNASNLLNTILVAHKNYASLKLLNSTKKKNFFLVPHSLFVI